MLTVRGCSSCVSFNYCSGGNDGGSGGGNESGGGGDGREGS